MKNSKFFILGGILLVLAISAYAYMQSSKPVTPDSGLDSNNNSQNTTPKMTDDWKQYENQQYSFSILIPDKYTPVGVYDNKPIDVSSLSQLGNDVYVIDGESSIHLMAENNSLFQLSSEQTTLSEYFESQVDQGSFERVRFNQMTWYKNIVHDKAYVLYSYPLTGGAVSVAFTEVDSDIQNKVLSSFRRTDILGEGWDLYRSDTLGFIMKHPEEWEVLDVNEGVQMIIPNSENLPLLENLGTITLNVTEEVTDNIIRSEKNSLSEAWLKELGENRDVSEEKVIIGGKDVVVLGPTSQPSGMSNKTVFVVIFSDKKIIVSINIYGGDQDELDNQIYNIVNSLQLL